MPARSRARGRRFSGARPRALPTPADYAIRLTVTESYGTGGSQQNVVNGTGPSVRLHDSPKELENLSMAFLGDFANSSVSPSTCVRDFSDGCRGKADEKSDIESNREHFVITNSSLRLQNVRVSPSGMSADTSVACSFTSRITKCEPGDKSLRRWQRRNRSRRLRADRRLRAAALVAVHQQLSQRPADPAGIQVLLLVEAELTCFVVH